MRAEELVDEERSDDHAGQAYREDESPRCAQCGDRVARDGVVFDDDGRPLCQRCSGRGLVRVIDDSLVRQGHLRVCPSCGTPTMIQHEADPSEAKMAVFGATIYRCTKCGRTVSFASPRALVAGTGALAVAAAYLPTALAYGTALALACVLAVVARVGWEISKYARYRRSG